MALTISTGCFINDSGYAQIFGDAFTDNVLNSTWLVLDSGAQEANQRLEIKAADNNATEGALCTIPISRVASDTITLKFYANTATYSPLVAINGDDSAISWNAASSVIVTHSNAQQYFRVYVAGSKVYEGAVGSALNNVWHDITFRFKSGGGYEIDINSATVYSGGSDTTDTLYFKASSWSTTGTYDFYVDDLAYTGYGAFSVHDAGQDYIYQEDGFDFSTLSVTHSGASSIGLCYRSSADGETYGDWSSWLTEAEFQAEGNFENPYLQLQVRFKGDPGAYISAVSITEIQDTTPPGVPTTAKYAINNTNNYALIWTEPTDADFSHCELRRVIGETTTYLGKNGSNLPEWQASPSTYWQFADDDTSADSLQSNYVDESVTGTPTYSVRSADTHGNFSAWVIFTNGGGSTGEVPGSPSITTATAGDTQVTLALTADDESDVVYVRYFIRDGEWSSESETFKRTGSGNVVVTGLTNGVRYWFVAYAKSGDVMSVWSDPMDAMPNDGSTDAPIVEVAEEIKNELNEASFSQTFTASRVYTQHSRLEKITDLEVWVQPVEQTITPKTRNKDQCEYSVDIGIFKRCQDDSEVDEMMYLADEIYRHFRRYSYEDNRKQVTVEAPTLYSPDYLLERGLFAAVVTLNVMEVA